MEVILAKWALNFLMNYWENIVHSINFYLNVFKNLSSFTVNLLNVISIHVSSFIGKLLNTISTYVSYQPDLLQNVILWALALWLPIVIMLSQNLISEKEEPFFKKLELKNLLENIFFLKSTFFISVFLLLLLSCSDKRNSLSIDSNIGTSLLFVFVIAFVFYLIFIIFKATKYLDWAEDRNTQHLNILQKNKDGIVGLKVYWLLSEREFDIAAERSYLNITKKLVEKYLRAWNWGYVSEVLTYYFNNIKIKSRQPYLTEFIDVFFKDYLRRIESRDVSPKTSDYYRDYYIDTNLYITQIFELYLEFGRPYNFFECIVEYIDWENENKKSNVFNCLFQLIYSNILYDRYDFWHEFPAKWKITKNNLEIADRAPMAPKILQFFIDQITTMIESYLYDEKLFKKEIHMAFYHFFPDIDLFLFFPLFFKIIYPYSPQTDRLDYIIRARKIITFSFSDFSSEKAEKKPWDNTFELIDYLYKIRDIPNISASDIESDIAILTEIKQNNQKQEEDWIAEEDRIIRVLERFLDYRKRHSEL